MNYLAAVDGFFLDSPGGGARVAWDIAQVMRDQGHRVTVFCTHRPEGTAEVSDEQGVTVIRAQLPAARSLDPTKLSRQIRAGAEVLRRAGGSEFDIVHVHMPLQGQMVLRALGRPRRLIYTCHSPALMEQRINWAAQGLAGRIKWMLGRGVLRRLEGSVLRAATAIHTLSRFTRSCIDDSYGVGGKVSVIPHWQREGFARRHDRQSARELLGWPTGAKIMLTVRRLGPRYGLDDAIRAAAPLLKARADAFLAIGGSGPLETPLKQLAASLGAGEKFWFLGRLSDEQLRQAYEAADMFVLPTRALECFGLIVLEALGYGIPVLSTDAGALPELLTPILPHWVVPAGNIEAMRAKLAAWLNGALGAPPAEALVDYVASHFGKDVITPRLVELLEG